MQLITLIDTTADNQPLTVDDPTFQQIIASSCGNSRDTCDAAPDCFTACESQLAMCRAQTYLALTRPQGAMVTLSGHYSVPLKAEPAKQNLAELGREQAVAAGEDFYEILRAATGLDPQADGPNNSACGNGTASFNGTPLATCTAGTGLTRRPLMFTSSSRMLLSPPQSTRRMESSTRPRPSRMLRLERLQSACRRPKI